MQSPRYESPEPAGVVGSYGPAVRRWAKRKLNLTLGGWQAYAIDQMLRHDAAGDLIHRIALLSTGRQNGKSVIVRVIIGWLLDEGQHLPPFAQWSTILTAAHDAKQARIVYANVLRDLLAHGDKGRQRTSMYQGISVDHVDFDIVTGQPGSARGWSAGLIGWDEMLTQKDWDMWEALAPTQNAQRSPLMVLTSTAGHEDSILLRNFYDLLVRQATGAEAADPTFYGAWWQSLDPDAGNDPDELLRGNPALEDERGTYLAKALASEYAIFPPDQWRREVMNHFVDRHADAAISPVLWGACRTPHPLRGVDGPYALGIDVALGASRATVAVAAVRSDGRIGVEVYKDLRNDPVTSQHVTRAVHAFDKPTAYIAYDKAIGVASSLERDGQERGLPYDGYQPSQMVEASMDVAEMISSRRLAVDDPLLDSQAPYVARRQVGSEGAFRFTRTASEGHIDAFMAMTLAVHAIAYTLRLPKVF